MYIEYWITGRYNNGMWCGYRKLGNYFHLTVSVDSSLIQWFYFRGEVILGLWMLSFGCLLSFCVTSSAAFLSNNLLFVVSEGHNYIYIYIYISFV